MEGGKDRMNPVIIGLELEICRNRDAYIYIHTYMFPCSVLKKA